MSPLVPLALWSWLIIGIAICAFFPPSKAIPIGFVGAWLFLPVHTIVLPVVPDLSRSTSATFGVIAGVLLFQLRSVIDWRAGWIDLPMLVWCGVGFITSVVNGLGPWDGASSVLSTSMLWGVPYLLGRVFFRTTESLKDLAMIVVIGGLIYVPFCLYEMKMWQSLHEVIYGLRNQVWHQTVRYGGYRPSVFMQHGLMVAVWMGNAAMIAAWLAWTKSPGKLLSVPMWLPAVALFLVTVACRSTGAIALMLLGTVALMVTRWFQTRIAIAALLVIPIVYVAGRATPVFSIDPALDFLVEQSQSLFGADRASSLAGRFHKESYYLAHAYEQPIFGWGGYNRMRPAEEDVEGAVRGVDSLWTIAFGMHGLVGLVSVIAAILIGPTLYILRFSPSELVSLELAPATVLAVVLALFMVDNLLNSMVNPVYMLAVGGLVNVATAHSLAAKALAVHPRETLRPIRRLIKVSPSD